MHAATTRFRAAIVMVITAAVTAGLATVPQSAEASSITGTKAPYRTASPASELNGSGRAEVLRLWQFGGPLVKKDAAVALTGTDADVNAFLATQEAPDAAIDRDIHVNQIMSVGGPATKAATQQALDANTDSALKAFLEGGWQAPHENDLALRVNQVMAAGGPQVKNAAQQALDANTEDALQGFLETGWRAPFAIDQNLKVNQVMAAGGPEVKKAAQQALDANTVDALSQFLEIDLSVAQARDAETANITDLVSAAKAASDQAGTETQAAKQESDRAVAAAAAAQKAAQAAKDAAAAAQGHAGQAADAANRAAFAADQAAATARQAIGAANAASNAAHTAASAASRAATAASQAGKAASHAYDAAAAAVAYKGNADAAAVAAQIAKEAALGAAAAADAARSARTVSQQAEAAGGLARDAATQSGIAADAAADAADHAAAAGGDARQAKAAAATARAQAGRAVAAANASQSWAHQASEAAGQAAAAADAAGSDANAAAQAAADAAAHAGEATDAAQKATAHANAATAAANAAVAAANQAAKIAQLARTADSDRIAAAGQAADDAAKAALTAYAAQSKPLRWDLDQASTWDTETQALIGQAVAPGTDRPTVIVDARRAALNLLSVGGPWTKAAAATALSGTDDEAAYFITTGLSAAAGQDDRVVLADLNEAGTPAFQKAAAAAMAGTDADVREFLRDRTYPGREQDDALEVNQIMSAARAAGRTVVVAEAQKALDANTDLALRDFLDTNQYTAVGVDDQLKVNQVMAAARTVGAKEVVAGAQAALDGPPLLLHEFLIVGQYTAARRDQNTAAHDAAIDGLLAQASSAAAGAIHDADEAQAAAARARGAADEAAGYVDQAEAAAGRAAASADQAQAAASRAAESANQAQASANMAARAAASAIVSADQATRSSAWAQHSAEVAAGFAQQAASSARTAHQAAVDAGKDSEAAAAAAKEAWESVATKAAAEKQQAVQQRRADCDDNARDPMAVNLLSNQDCVLLFSGTKTDQQRIVAHLQEICRQHIPQGDPTLQRCLDAHNLLSANFMADLRDDFTNYVTSGRDSGLSMLLGVLGVLVCPECELADILGGAAAELGGTAGAGELAGVADAAVGSSGLLDAASAQARAEISEAEDLAQQAAVEKGRLADIEEELAGGPRPCGPNSFAAETPVLMADGATKPIKDVKVGDWIANASPESARLERHQVDAVHVTDNDTDFVNLTVGTPRGPAGITTTAHHRFWVTTTHAWTAAADIVPGQQLDAAGDERITVVADLRYADHIRTYNLTINGLHTYYVFAGGVSVLVHNSGPGCLIELGPGIKSADALKQLNPSTPEVEFVFEPSTGRFLTGDPSDIGLVGSPHEQLARALDADENAVLGGTIYREGGELVFTENSGHYGHRWDGMTRDQFQAFLNSYGVIYRYKPWG
ncbi:polymorphic toxin type 43 domain-containing protein [Amycolatopsis sp. NBC_00345]|uniref:polymorphic toxin type 43 domain-containing protein n=1 Tax=Amycolatopsis sp. NBC_00345 TaxID=2975955 RepID=UPI002E25B5EC